MQFQQRVEIAEAKARRPNLMLDHDHRDGRIDEQFQELGTAIVDTGTDLLHHLMNVIALGGAIRHQSLRLALQIRTIFRR